MEICLAKQYIAAYLKQIQYPEYTFVQQEDFQACGTVCDTIPDRIRHHYVQPAKSKLEIKGNWVSQTGFWSVWDVMSFRGRFVMRFDWVIT